MALAGKTNLREASTRFVGREKELAELARRLASGDRLVTILGPPGVGKTRIAIRCGLAHLDQFAGGVWFCDLSDARGVEAICGALVQALGAGPPAGGRETDLRSVVGELLAERENALVLLDGAESAIEPAASCLEVWLEQAPEVQFVVTSRERMAIPGERVLDLDGLSLVLGPASEPAAAVELFCDRAEAVRGSAAFGPDDVQRISVIVRALEGIPLAIELAAARSRVLGPAQLIEQLPRALDLFRAGRTGDPRHATLRAAIDWSWRLLERCEQTALAQMSVFRGGFTLAAAEAVIDLGDLDARPVLEVVESLCDKSLIASGDDDGERRFRCYAVVREFAAEALAAAGGEDAARTRHSEFFAAAGAEWVRASRGDDSASARARLRAERGNLVAAHQWALDRPGGSRSIDLALALLPAVEVATVADQPLASFRARLDRTIAAADAASPQPELLARALLMRMRASFAEARVNSRDVERALALLGADGDPSLRGLAWYYAGFAWRYRGDLERAREGFERAVKLFEASDPPGHLLSHAITELARVLGELAQHECARSNAEKALHVATHLGSPAARWTALEGSIGIHRAAGAFEAARRQAERALAIATELGESWRELKVLHEFADVERDLGELDGARQRLEQAARRVEAIGWPLQRAFHLGHAAFLAEDVGDCEAAARDLAEACEAFRAAGFARHYALLLVHLAASLAGADRLAEAHLALSRARTGLSADFPLDSVLLPLGQAHLDLALARHAQASGDAGVASRYRDEAASRVAELWQSLSADPAVPPAVPIAATADVRLLHRRFHARLAAQLASSPDPIVLDCARHELRWEQSVLSLRSRPVLRKLLYALCLHRDQVVSREAITRAVWECEYEPARHDGSIKANVRNLRNALRESGLEVEFVHSGYRLRAPSHFVIEGGEAQGG